MARQGATDVDLRLLTRSAEALGVDIDMSSGESASRHAGQLLRACALRASRYVADQAVAFAASQGQNLKIVLSFPGQDVAHARRVSERKDQSFVDYLSQQDLLLFDALQAHGDEFAQFRCSPEEYTDRYYHGHYNPRGNHFYAYGLKNPVVEWLDPSPPSY